MKRRILTALLALCVTFTSFPADTRMYAGELPAAVQGVTEDSTADDTAEDAQGDLSGPEGTEAGTERRQEEEAGADTETPDGETEQKPGAGTDVDTEPGPDAGAPDSETPDTGKPGSEMTGTVQPDSETPDSVQPGAEDQKPATPDAVTPEGAGTDGTPEEDDRPAGSGSDTEEKIPEDTENAASEDAEEKAPEKTQKSLPEKDVPEGDAPEISRDIKSLENTEDAEEAGKLSLNYVMAGSDYVEAPGTQQIVASLGETGRIPTDVKLIYRNRTGGQQYEAAADAQAEDLFLFTLQFPDSSQSGVYELTGISYVLDGKEGTLTFDSQGLNVQFGVNTKVSVEPDVTIFDEAAAEAAQAEIDASVITLDGQGNVTSEKKVEDVLNNGLNGALKARSDLKRAGPLTVVLDPGHDSTHAGARYNNSAEETLVLKIAKYCRDELVTYGGVKVYMVRESESCPYGLPAGAAAQCNANRVEYAAGVGANVYVSFHLNASTSSSANGVGVYYPNSNYRPDLGEIGKGLASAIYYKLRALGLSDWAGGILIRNAVYDKYPDGSAADYLAVIRRSKEKGIPAVLIEHAFLSGTSDYNNFLSTDEGLKKLGVADATAIAEYYGLKKGGGAQPVISYAKSQEDGSLKLKWNAVEGAVSYEVHRSTKRDTSYDVIAKVKGTTYTDESAKTGKQYYYRVWAIFSNGGHGEASDAMAGRVLEQPELTYVKTTGSKKLEISWKSVNGAGGYKILRSEGSDGEYEEIAKITADKTTHTDSVSSNNKAYSYRVQAYHTSGSAEGVGAASEAQTARSIAKASVTSVKADDEGALVVTWKKVKGAEGYIITRSTEKNGKYKKIKTVKSSDTTSYADAKASVGQTYYYKVEAYRSDNGQTGTSGASAAVSGRISVATKVSYVMSKKTGAIEIGWEKRTGAWGYRIRRSTSSKGSYAVVKTVRGKNTTSWQDTSVTAGKKYYYKVEIVYSNDGKKSYSDASASKSGMSLAKTTITSASGVNSTSLKLKWNKVTGAGGYQIYRSTMSGSGYKLVAETDADETSYKDTGLKAGKTYYYKVRAFKKSGKKKGVATFSAVQKAWTLKQAKIADVSLSGSSKITISWNKTAKATGYKVYRSTGTASGFKLVKTISSGSTLTYTDTSVKAGKVYYYRVAATAKIKGKTTGRGSYSETLRIPVLSGSEITFAEMQHNAVQITWKQVKNADGYQLSGALREKDQYRTLMNGKTLSYAHTSVQLGTTYYYKVRPYALLPDGTKVYGAWSAVKSQVAGHAIMGKSSVTTSQMLAYYKSYYQFPSDIFASKGAATAENFFTILKEEADAEGVKAEVLFAQVMLETGGLRFGGDVQAWQCNFGGLGATGNGVSGEVFPDVRTGLRAQVQHLKAYASREPLKNPCVDSRFFYVTRGSAPYVEWLAIPKNPTGKGWATDPDYGTKLLRIINSL